MALLQQNLEQEESTARLIEGSMPMLLQAAMGRGDLDQGMYSQGAPSY